jgi:hypothetical protein
LDTDATKRRLTRISQLDANVLTELRSGRYLKSARLEHGLLINFGSYKFEIRKFAWSENQPQRTQRTQRILGVFLSAFSALFAVK